MAVPVIANPPKLLDRVRLKLRMLQYAWKTEKAYVAWIEKFLRWQRDQCGGEWRHPTELGKAEIEAWLTWLAAERSVSKSTQQQAFSAILFPSEPGRVGISASRVESAASRLHELSTVRQSSVSERCEPLPAGAIRPLGLQGRGNRCSGRCEALAD